MIKMRRTAHIRWVYGGPARCQPQARHFRDVISLYPQSRGRCWAGTAPSTARTPRSAVRCDAQIGPEGEVAGFALGSSRPRSCQRAGSVKKGGREARARLGQGGAPEAQGVSGRGAEARLSALGNPSEAFGSALRN